MLRMTSDIASENQCSLFGERVCQSYWTAHRTQLELAADICQIAVNVSRFSIGHKILAGVDQTFVQLRDIQLFSTDPIVLL